MQIEGTPNERALLVTFAYIAGFTAAFILFGVAALHTTGSSIVVAPAATTQTAGVIHSTTQPDTPPAASPSSVAASSDLVYENNGLYFYADQEFAILLSKEKAAAGVSYTADAPLSDTQGFHTALPHYQFIAAQDVVFFCEQYAVTGVCTPYMFDVVNETLYVFRDADGPITISSNDARLVNVTSAGSFVLGNYRSVQPEQPWEVVAR